MSNLVWNFISVSNPFKLFSSFFTFKAIEAIFLSDYCVRQISH